MRLDLPVLGRSTARLLTRSGPVRRRHRDDQPDLFGPRTGGGHWADHYARLLVARHPGDHRIVIQTSMSPSGAFHVGNLRDTACAVLVQRALWHLGRAAVILLSFDDYDPGRASVSCPELAHLTGRPLADGGVPVRSACTLYVAELVALGWAPAGLLSAAQAGDETVTWLVHHQAERYRAGTYVALQRRYQREAATLAGLLKVASPEALFRVYCQNCGRNSTDILELEEGHVRYSCRSCGSLWTTTDPSAVKPAWALDWTLRVAHEGIDCEPAGADHTSSGSTMDRTRPLYDEFLRRPRPVIVPYGFVRSAGAMAKISGSRGGGPTPTDLLAVLSGPMILWWYARLDSRSDLRVGLDLASLTAWYDGYDRFLSRAPGRPGGSDNQLLRLVQPDLEDTGLPGWRRIVGLLQARCFRVETVVAELAGGTAPASDALRNRVRRCQAWLSGPGREHCWLVAHADERPVSDDEAALLRDGDRLAATWTRATYALLYRALFRTHSGPPLRVLRELFGEAAIIGAIRRREEAPLLAIVHADLGEHFHAR